MTTQWEITTDTFTETTGPVAEGETGTSHTDIDAENGTTYYYRVTSVNAEEAESSASNEVEKTPFSDPPDRPE